MLGSVLVFVLGHSECGAVEAAIETATTGEVPPGDLGAVVAPIIPAVEALEGTLGIAGGEYELESGLVDLVE